MNLFPIKTSVNVSVNADLTEATTEAVKTVSNSVKGIQDTVQKPIHEATSSLIIAINNIVKALSGEWVAERIGNMKRATAQAEKDCLDIANGTCQWDSNKHKVLPITPDATLQQCCLSVTQVEEIQKAERLFKGIAETLKQLKDYTEKPIPDMPIDKNFFSHWRNEAELIDDEEVRQLWSRLLTGEICKPKSISIKTLNTVKNLSQEEARIYSRLVCYRINDGIIIDSNNYPLHGSYSDLMLLIDAGLIMPTASKLTFNDSAILSEKKCYIFPFEEVVLAIQSEKEPSVNGHMLTRVGKELLTINENTVSLDNIKDIAIEISKRNGNCLVTLHKLEKCTSSNNDRVYKLTPIWTYPSK